MHRGYSSDSYGNAAAKGSYSRSTCSMGSRSRMKMPPAATPGRADDPGTVVGRGLLGEVLRRAERDRAAR